jgi:copper chaperone
MECIMLLHIENMTCGGCVKAITRVVASLDPKATVDADLPARTVTIRTSVAKDDIERALAKGGWAVRSNEVEKTP